MLKFVVIAGVVAVAAFGAKKFFFDAGNDEPIEYFPPAEDERLAA